ncbi:hypothetical protein [Streptomyces sp. NPDC050988]|uniref:hypothetical protein n=1 Tax=Streptomyces sp. NPDC050988 TaxID=3365637 RepID=UPI00379441D2
MTAEVKDIHFPPILNGVDYLVSVVDLLKYKPTPRDLKYAVLHLQAAAEVLLKARLQIEHWSLVFKDVGKAKKRQYQDADFESAATVETVRRLRDIVGISIADKDAKSLDDLARTRNALQHYGLKASAPAIEARAVTVLDFLIRFLDEELLWKLPSEDRSKIAGDMDRIRGGLTDIEIFVKKRMQRLRRHLETVENYTVTCPNCLQVTLVVNEDDSRDAACYFCSAGYTPYQAAVAYTVEVVGHPAGDAYSAVPACPECNDQAIALNVAIAADLRVLVDFCFSCARAFRDLKECGRCARLFEPDHGEGVCDQCRWDEHHDEMRDLS